MKFSDRDKAEFFKILHEGDIAKLEKEKKKLQWDIDVLQAHYDELRRNYEEYDNWYCSMISHDKEMYELWCKLKTKDPSFKYFSE